MSGSPSPGFRTRTVSTHAPKNSNVSDKEATELTLGSTLGSMGIGSQKGNTVDACSVRETTNLSSPVPKILAKLAVGTTLTVTLQGDAKLLAVFEDQIVGSITSARMVLLAQCIRERGVEYVAVVLSITGGSCLVRVQPK